MERRLLLEETQGKGIVAENITFLGISPEVLFWNIFAKQVDKTDWKRHANPAVVNAFYSSIENSIQFPAGILQVKNNIS